MQFILIVLLVTAVFWALSSMGIIKKKSLELILIADDHTSTDLIKKEAKLIEEKQPEYVLLESLNDLPPEQAQKFIDIYKIATLNELANHVGINLNDLNIAPNVIPSINRALAWKVAEAKRDVYSLGGSQKDKKATFSAIKEEMYSGVPKDFNSLLNTPLYTFSSEILEVIKTRINTSQADPSAVDWVYHKIKFFGKDLGSMHQIGYLLRAIGTAGATPAGCDIDKSGLRKNLLRGDPDKLFDRLKEHQDKVESKDTEREIKMGNTFVEYVKKRTHEKPIIGIVGKLHLKKTSPIHSILDNAGINYKVEKFGHKPKRNLRGLLYGLEH
ncbi:hypothetical protein HN924_03105 [Candidatus Woesearchaeota archaeon]|nr:hypothetical protein [Candidatus Woesearchaeota archaeon]MBT7062931.1 hypothetical protein [Candidatus Woesearchaeota archaeon]MBT7402639.1 hypothetical protein [Candidatus Woesearchaeota archaeon]